MVFIYLEKIWKEEIIQLIPKGEKVNVKVGIGFYYEKRSDFYKLAKNLKFKKLGYFANLYPKILDRNLFVI